MPCSISLILCSAGTPLSHSVSKVNFCWSTISFTVFMMAYGLQSPIFKLIVVRHSFSLTATALPFMPSKWRTSANCINFIIYFILEELTSVIHLALPFLEFLNSLYAWIIGSELIATEGQEDSA